MNETNPVLNWLKRFSTWAENHFLTLWSSVYMALAASWIRVTQYMSGWEEKGWWGAGAASATAIDLGIVASMGAISYLSDHGKSTKWAKISVALLSVASYWANLNHAMGLRTAALLEQGIKAADIDIVALRIDASFSAGIMPLILILLSHTLDQVRRTRSEVRAAEAAKTLAAGALAPGAVPEADASIPLRIPGGILAGLHGSVYEAYPPPDDKLPWSVTGVPPEPPEWRIPRGLSPTHPPAPASATPAPVPTAAKLENIARLKAILEQEPGVDPITLATKLGASVSSVYRWAEEAGYQPLSRGQGVWKLKPS